MSTADDDHVATGEGVPSAEPADASGPTAGPGASAGAGAAPTADPAPAPISDTDTDAEITEKLKHQGVRLGRGSIAPAVFWPSLIIVLAFALFAIVFPQAADTALTGTQNWIVSNLGWFYQIVIAVFIVFVIVIAFSRFGRITLGKDGEKPEFGVFSWFAMLFAAGMGIGLVFYSVGEPLTFATSGPKPGWPGTETTAEGITSVIPGMEIDVAQLAMAQTFVHWGLHPWAAYAVIGLALAYAIHRRGRPVSIRWALEPLFGDRVKGWLGDVVDVLAIFGTLFGIATSLGLGVQQISSGLMSMGVVDTASNTLLVILVVVITFLATASVITGLGTGIKWLSNINLSLAGLLLISVLLLGPTLFLFQNFAQSLGVYFSEVLGMTLDAGAYTGDAGADWAASWTIFYWGWWMAWAPFVGVFIARISRGRTIRQFIAGVLLVPTTVGFFWFSVIGGAGLYRQLFGAGDLVGEEGVLPEAALFDMLGGLPLGGILSVIAIILVAIFFITSSDSGSLVVDMLASGGHPNPPTWSRVMFALLEGLLAIALLLSGGLTALQAGSLITALPFSVILLLMCWATFRSLSADQARRDELERRARYEWFSEQLAEDFDDTLGRQVDTRIDDRIDYRLARTTGPFDRSAQDRPPQEEHSGEGRARGLLARFKRG
ncbi:BCCT family transporter [Brevibacterium jeotgali]|uniref:Choline/glycine/proline betaine transport protein n=1 Tax=Brevibacterium jeotgali TaxID=1262550 RepID=A0A2H1L4M6_9MICO|nr:BCCT family transporter [Brevibacterium jeotgali]TWB98580.1 choline/glycine/proline betaine transport protein [Brevibacterium jeotgali]SMY11819.1 choline/glycine/proline betaine transport protein [Brevibacterium jeotgali]